MAPDRGWSTATLDPVPNGALATAILNPIVDRETWTAIIDGGEQVLASVTCMGMGVEAKGGLLICTNTSSRTIRNLLPLNPTEERTAAVVFPVERPVPTPQVQAVMKKVTTVSLGAVTFTSTTHGDNQGVMLDPSCSQAEVDHHSIAIGQGYHSYATTRKQALSQCTDIEERTTRPGQTIFKQTDSQNSSQLTNIEAKAGSSSCKYVNTEPCDVKQNLCKKDAYHDEFGATTNNSWKNCDTSCTNLHCHMPPGRGQAQVSNWLRVVKPEDECPASLTAEESWPPLLASRSKGETFDSQNRNSSTSCINSEDRIKPFVTASYANKHVGHAEFQSSSYTTSPYVKPVLLLDEHSWPSLEKACKHTVTHDSNGSNRKRRTLQPLVSSNFHDPGLACTMQGRTWKGQQNTPHGGFHTTEKLHIPPLLLMLNKDFIVTSPLKENLLLTLALMGKRSDTEAPKTLQAQTTEGETKRQILVGQFKAFSSYLHFMLGRDATRVRTESNAGGTSTISESLSVEYFVRRFQAKDIVTEMEVEYRSFNWKKVDFICTVYGQRVGVSVTRAMSFPDPKDFSTQMAYRLLYKKLFGLVVARHGVSKRHSFSQCILHVWCETQQTAHIMQTEYDGVSQELDIADDVVMVLTVADGCHARPIFYESLLGNS